MEQANNPLHGKTLEMILKELVDHFGWFALGIKFKMKCFRSEPSIKSCLTFLRKNQWARDIVEREYLWMISKKKRKK